MLPGPEKPRGQRLCSRAPVQDLFQLAVDPFEPPVHLLHQSFQRGDALGIHEERVEGGENERCQETADNPPQQLVVDGAVARALLGLLGRVAHEPNKTNGAEEVGEQMEEKRSQESGVRSKYREAVGQQSPGSRSAPWGV
jgi:hypothetical protein